ncbi:MAG TPA: siroheme synthase CysG [Paracoccaceae bacterium]|nr:siroheme synthase CysG [Paracoccaceae bacterium]
MRHFPLFRDLRGRRVVVSGGGETALAKLRLILKTEATVAVYAADPAPELERLAAEGRLRLTRRPVAEGDAICAALLYAANDDAAEDARAAAVGRRAGALVNVVDDLEGSDVITPAMVDRDPVVVAIGTEGAAPVLARRIKAETEERLAPELGTLARLGRAFRPQAEALPMGRARRAFWSRYYDRDGPEALAEGGEAAVTALLPRLLAEILHAKPEPGRVAFVGAGPGDPELLTLKARRLLHEADVVIHDRLVGPGVLELARREARMIEVGKVPGGPSWKQDDINAEMIRHAATGAHVVRLKSGDPGVFGRLDEEMDALDAAGVAFDVTPGVTSAAAAAATLKVSLTKRGRNKSFRLITGHDADGFAEHDWRALAAPGATAAVYMGLRASRFLQGRLLLHGADPATPVTAVEHASRPEQRILSAPLSRLPEALREAGLTGPAILFLGLAPREALEAAETLSDPLAAVGG